MADPVSIAVNVAASVAFSLLSSALTPHPKPSLQDLTITSSAYGSPLAIPYGAARVTGQLIWSDGLKKAPKNGKFGKGGGGGKGKSGGTISDAQSWHANLAYSICEGPVDALMTVWANGIIIYDATGQAKDPTSGKKVGTGQYNIRFYRGTEDQLPDPLIKTYTESVHGVGSTPAYRGTSYIVVEGMNLTKFGNSIPTIHCAVTKNFAESTTISDFSQAGATMSVDSDHMVFDWLSETMYSINSSGISTYDVSGGNDVLILQRTWAQLGFDSGTYGVPASWGLTPNKYLIGTGFSFWHGGGSGLENTFHYFDLNSLQYTGKDGQVSGTSYAYATYGMQVDDSVGNMANYIITVGLSGLPFLYCIDSAVVPGLLFSTTVKHRTIKEQSDFSAVISGGDTFSFGSGSTSTTRVVLQQPSDGQSKAYILPPVVTNGHLGVYQLTTNVVAHAKYEKLQAISLTDLNLNPVGTYLLEDVQLDLTDNGLIISLLGYAGVGVGNATFKWLSGTGVVWVRNDIVVAGLDKLSGGTNSSFVTSGNYGHYDYIANKVRLINTSTGATVWEHSISLIPNTVAYDGPNRSLIMWKYATSKLERYYLGNGSNGGTTLDQVVLDICLRTGLSTGDVDVTALSGIPVTGYVISRRSDAKQVLQQLAELFFFDCIESGSVLKFVVRGSDATFNIPQKDLAEARSARGKKMNDSNYWKHTKKQEIETPSEYHVKYFDPALNYQIGDQYIRRNGGPTATSSSKIIKTLDVPIVMTATQATQIAQKGLFQEWVERDTYEAGLGWKYLWMDPADAMTVSLDNGDVYAVRGTKNMTGADLTMSCSFVATDSQTYFSVATGSTGGGMLTPGGAISSTTTTMILLDLPILRDEDNPGDTGDYLLYGGVVTSSGNWLGAAVYLSTDSGRTYNPHATMQTQMMAGTIFGTLPPTYSPFMIDYSYTIKIYPYRGVTATLSNTTEDNLLSYNANMMAIGDEIIQFLNATLNADGSYTLSGILRGCRGTDYACNFHSVAEQFVLLNSSLLYTDLYSVEQVGASWTYNAATFGSFIDTAAPKTIKLTGAALKPYPPVNFTRTVSGSDLMLGWERRTRYGGGWFDGTGVVPLNETTEAYEIYILPIAYNPATFDPAIATSYTRKLTSVTTSATYTAAMMTADGFSPSSSTLYMVVYQLSGNVGRGFPGAQTLLAIP